LFVESSQQQQHHSIPSAIATNSEVTVVSVQAAVADYLDGDKDATDRRRNVVIYRIPESAGTVQERKHEDTKFVRTLLTNVLELDTGDNDIVKMFRLDRYDSGGTGRPLLIGFKDEELKGRIMSNLCKLKAADASFKRISVTHDLTPQQRQRMKEIVEVAKQSYCERTGNPPENFRYLVVGQNTKNPKVIQL